MRGGVRLVLLGCLLAACSPQVSPTPAPFDDDAALQAARREGRVMQALYLTEAQAARDGWTAEQLQAAGTLWNDAGDPLRALSYWQAAADAAPDNLSLARTLAQSYVELQQWPQALDALTHYLSLSPDDAWASLQLGLILLPANPREAEIHLKRVEQEPGYQVLVGTLLDVMATYGDDPLVSARAGLALIDLEQWPYAERAFQHAVEAQGPLPLLLAYTGYTRTRQGKDGAALFEQAITLAPDDPQVQFLHGLYLRTADDFAGSLDALAQALALAPDNPAYQAELASAYRLLGDLPHAEYWLRQAAEIGDSRFSELLEQFYAEEIDHLTVDGLDAFLGLTPSAPDNPDRSASRGWALYRAGRAADALAQLEAVLEDTPDHNTATYYRARILAETGDADGLALLEDIAASDSPFAANAAADLQRLSTQATPEASAESTP